MFLALSGIGLIFVSIIAFILILGIIISLHELGHLLVAKKCGILCYEYSIGMGPIIYKRMIGETRFCIRAIPIGGFVSMADAQYFDDDIKKEESIGLILDEENKIKKVVLDPNYECEIRGKVIDIDLIGASGEERFVTLDTGTNDALYYTLGKESELLFEKGQTLPLVPYEKTFESKKKLPRIATLFAGSFMNFLLALVLFFIISFSIGVANESSNKIGGVSTDYPAELVTVNNGGNAYTIKKGDRITMVGGSSSSLISVDSWKDFSNEMDKIYDDYSTKVYLVTDKIEGLKDDSNNQIYFEMEAVTILNSIGISNVGLDLKYLGLTEVPNVSGQLGLRLGRHFSGWKNDIETADYITKISIDGTTYDVVLGETVDGKSLTGWGYLTYLMEEHVGKGEPKIYLEYYKLKDDKETSDIYDDVYELVTIEDSIKAKDNYKPYTDEVLKSQGINKIEHYIGVSASTHVTMKCIPQAFKMFFSESTTIFKTLKLLLFPSDVRQVDASNLTGVVGIFGMIKSSVNNGFIPLLSFMAMLTVNIGIVNLLPIPALDGGRILFVIIEAITKKRVPKKVEGIINLVFMGLLLLLMIYVTFNDVSRIFG
ncbi:MAG: site-2 protease family protein [Acholeplasmatales bacterium]|nr:site-2 protease family protein [Acholeplasmatales bacterium]